MSMGFTTIVIITISMQTFVRLCVTFGSISRACSQFSNAALYMSWVRIQDLIFYALLGCL